MILLVISGEGILVNDTICFFGLDSFVIYGLLELCISDIFPLYMLNGRFLRTSWKLVGREQRVSLVSFPPALSCPAGGKNN